MEAIAEFEMQTVGHREDEQSTRRGNDLASFSNQPPTHRIPEIRLLQEITDQRAKTISQNSSRSLRVLQFYQQINCFQRLLWQWEFWRIIYYKRPDFGRIYVLRAIKFRTIRTNGWIEIKMTEKECVRRLKLRSSREIDCEIFLVNNTGIKKSLSYWYSCSIDDFNRIVDNLLYSREQTVSRGKIL